ncbi:MAG: OBAP family protein [Chitinophagaceae bacterium]|nr:OBAP family protein [Chitinophagaceae bacterium]
MYNSLMKDTYQAIIFDGNTRDAKIMGVEYIITERLFKELDEEEKRLWHSHHHEVKSGTLIAPGIPVAVENNTLDYLREFIIDKEDLTSSDTEMQLKLFFHLKKEQLGPNKDYKYKTKTLNLKTLVDGEIPLRSDVGPEIVQMFFKVTRN